MTNSISTLGQALDQISRLKTQQRNMDTLATQLNTGKKTQNFSGLGNDVLLSKRTRSNINTLDSYLFNISQANRRINLMNTSITQMTKQAKETLTSLQLSLQQGEYPNLSAIQDNAEDVVSYLYDLMNTQDGDRYLFAGADSAIKPISETGQFATFIGSFTPDETNLNNPPIVSTGLIGQWCEGTISNEEFIAAYKATSDEVLGYSETLSEGQAGKISTRVDDNQQLDYTVLANSPGMKDLLIAMRMLQSLPPIENAPGSLNDSEATTLAEDSPPNPPLQKQDNFYAVLDSISAMIDGALKKINQESFKIAQTQTRLNVIKDSHTQEKNTLQTIVSQVEDVDTTEVAAKITQLQVQLEASYQVTALVSRLSLVNFL